MEKFEDKLKQILLQYLRQEGAVGERFPICPDVEDKWKVLLESYLPDGVREFNDYPMVSLGWTMFLGMAIAKYWDEDWVKYDNMSFLYEYIRDKRGFTCTGHSSYGRFTVSLRIHRFAERFFLSCDPIQRIPFRAGQQYVPECLYQPACPKHTGNHPDLHCDGDYL